ncbi:MAG: GAF domain-containing protein [Pseudomonadota bacterium]
MSDGGLAGDLLSKREREVAVAYAAGASNKEIARDLGLSPTTVRSHLRTVYSKLGVTSKIELAQTLDEGADPKADRDRSDMAADLALELDDAIRRERSLAQVLRIISNHDGCLDTAIDDVLAHALEICEAEFGILFEYHGDFQVSELRSRGISPAFRDWLSEVGTFKVEPTTGVGRAVSELKPVSIDDVRAGGVYDSGSQLRIATVDHGNARSLAAIPIISGKRLIGVFTVYRTRLHPFNERTLELVQLFADQAAIAIENVRQFRELQTRLEREAATREILSAINHSRDDDTPVFDVILENAARLCRAPLAFAAMVNAERTHLEFKGSKGEGFDAFIDVITRDPIPLDPEVTGAARAILDCKTVVYEEYSGGAQAVGGSPISAAAVNLANARSLVDVPLVSRGIGIGVIVLWRTEVDPFEPDDIALVETFAAQAVIAIENVRQFRELQTRLEREAASAEILEVISQNRDDEQPVFDAILQRAMVLCDAISARLHVRTQDGAHGRVRAMCGEQLTGFEVGYEYPLSDPGPVSEVFESARVVKIDNIADDDLYRTRDPVRVKLVEEEGLHSYLVVPLVLDGTAIGVITLSRKELRPFAPDQITLIETFAAQAVIAIENVRQFKALENLNAELGDRVEEQVGEIERMGRLKRFLPAAVADTVISSGSETMLKSHRALLGVLFCDMRGFTAFCETAEPEETIEVLQTYHEEMGKLINEHGAGVDHRMGDGIMVLFNDPLPCEDPAGEAVRLALAMRVRMEELCKAWKRLGHRLGFGVGISLGYATVGMVGYEGRYDYTASGTAVNVAARLCEHAEDGEILLSPRAWTAVEDRIAASSRGEVAFKGINREIEVMCIAPGAELGD